ncbi:hypothetical protein [Streptomyces sp. XY006]|uniref:hypothetical protein n=1 Tax=Streptomyces sp. XY006 TaxID=2021410 RepID=UPI000B8C56BB|nr:hypothetical protein [Streptomyces sp. XY006]OXS31766.1 hypothetical protein CHR28_29585 [Streptomyces sp. XY006]
MSHEHDRDHSGKQPETALEEVLREIEDAETRTEDSAAQRRHRGEAGDATSPNTGAQDQAEGD